LLIAAPAKKKRRLKPELMRKLIIELCDERYWTAPELAEWLNRSADNLRQRFLMQLVAEGLLERRYPNEPNRPDQAYTKAKKPPGKKGTA
jgi:predicted ArsR family transcriptional regulator